MSAPILSVGRMGGIFAISRQLPKEFKMDCLEQFVVRKEETDEFYLAKIVRVNPSREEETEEDMNGILCIHTEHIILVTLKDEPGIARSHGLFTQWATEQYVDNGESKTRKMKLISHVIDAYAPDLDDQNPKLYRDRVTLDAVFRHYPKLPERLALKIFAQLANSVRSSHQRNITLMDLDPKSIILNVETGEVTLTNFFMSKPPQRLEVKLSVASRVAEYFPPELITGEEFSYPPVDSWGLGILLFRMIFGNFPFEGTTNQEILEKVTGGQYEMPEETNMSNETGVLIAALLSPDPSERIVVSYAAEMARLMLLKFNVMEWMEEVNFLETKLIARIQPQ